jgi:hypothetical protein
VEGKQFTLYAEDHNKIINLVAIENGESAMREDQKIVASQKKRENENEMNLISSEAHVK